MNGKKVYGEFLKKKSDFDFIEVKMRRLLQSFKIKYNIENEIGGIDTIFFDINDYGFLTVQISKDKYTDTWAIQFHKNFCEEFNIKLIKREEIVQYRCENGYVNDYLIVCEYTYTSKSNENFEEIKI